MFHFKLDDILTRHEITSNALAREAKVRPNLVYELRDGKTKRVELASLEKILVTLSELTGKPVQITDIIEFKQANRKHEEKPSDD